MVRASITHLYQYNTTTLVSFCVECSGLTVTLLVSIFGSGCGEGRHFHVYTELRALASKF